VVSASSPDVALLAAGGLVVVIDLVDGREVVVLGGRWRPAGPRCRW
jgi:hypothetical protein